MYRCPRCGKQFQDTLTCPTCGKYFGPPTNTKKIKKLQRHLIPLNIVMMVISLVAALSLIFTPVLQIDVAKFVKDPQAQTFIIEYVEKALEGNGEENGESNREANDENSGNSENSGIQISLSKLVPPVLTNVFKNIDATLTISTLNAAKVAFSQNKTDALLDELFFGEKGVVTGLISGLSEGMKSALTKPESKEEIENAVIATIADAAVNSLKGVEGIPQEAIDKVNVEELTTIVKELNGVQNEQGAVDVVNKLLDNLDGQLGDDIALGEEQRTQINDAVITMYRETVSELGEGENFSVEALICVAISKGLLGNLPSDGENNGEENTGAVQLRAVAADEPATPNPDETPSNPDETPSAPEGEKEVYTTYEELLGKIDSQLPTSEQIAKQVKDALNENIEQINGFFSYYGYLFYSMVFFAAMWFILFLFALFHTFSKNKRFMMWYAKLFGGVPCFIFGISLLVAKPVLTAFFAEFEFLGIAMAALGAISTMTWISGACYLAMWIISIFWAFPIKHKIRKLKKLRRA